MSVVCPLSAARPVSAARPASARSRMSTTRPNAATNSANASTYVLNPGIYTTINGSHELNPGIYVIKDEIWEGGKHDRIGLLCMANRGHNTNGAQFFVTEEPRPNLDGNYTIFGECSPAQVIHDIAKVPTDASDKPETPVTIKSVTISRAAKP